MAKRKGKEKNLSLIPEPTKEVKVVPKDLEDQWGSCMACATSVNVLDKGMFPHQYLGAVRESRAFLVRLHEQVVEQALTHPQAHMISELNDILKERKNEAAKS